MIENEHLVVGEVLHLLSPEVQLIIQNKNIKFTDVFLMEIILRLNRMEQRELKDRMDREIAKQALMDSDDMQVPDET